jgi:hypothetical protein
VQTGLPRELPELLTRATQPGLVSPGGADQAQRYHPASLSSESGESLCYMDAELSSSSVSMVMRSPCAGDALDPCYGKFLIKLSLARSLSPSLLILS